MCLFVPGIATSSFKPPDAFIFRRHHHFARALRSLFNARRAIAAGAWSGIANTELTLISHKT
jgi:hypothetical protein